MKISIDLGHNCCHSKIILVCYLVVVSEKNVVDKNYDKLFVNEINTAPSPQLYICLLASHHKPAPRMMWHDTPSGVSMQPERAGHTLCFIGQGDGIHYPVAILCLETAFPSAVLHNRKELFWGPKALSSNHRSARPGQRKPRAGSASSRGSALPGSPPGSLNGVIGTLGT